MSNFEPQPQSQPQPQPLPPPAVSDTTVAFLVYLLYFLSYFTGITAVAGVIIAHVQIDTADPMLQTHYRFQIRTFWIGLFYFVVGVVLAAAMVGIVILFFWFIWSLVRNIRGVLALNEKRPIPNPESWMFG